MAFLQRVQIPRHFPPATKSRLRSTAPATKVCRSSRWPACNWSRAPRYRVRCREVFYVLRFAGYFSEAGFLGSTGSGKALAGATGAGFHPPPEGRRLLLSGAAVSRTGEAAGPGGVFARGDSACTVSCTPGPTASWINHPPTLGRARCHPRPDQTLGRAMHRTGGVAIPTLWRWPFLPSRRARIARFDHGRRGSHPYHEPVGTGSTWSHFNPWVVQSTKQVACTSRRAVVRRKTEDRGGD